MSSTIRRTFVVRFSSDDEVAASYFAGEVRAQLEYDLLAWDIEVQEVSSVRPAPEGPERGIAGVERGRTDEA